ncbi:hypothetical protein G7046_g9239 [Stylonectria norvegica]|nr:hypothetical protein G7046_g9239 [Stylonectria norvegica]
MNALVRFKPLLRAGGRGLFRGFRETCKPPLGTRRAAARGFCKDGFPRSATLPRAGGGEYSAWSRAYRPGGGTQGGLPGTSGVLRDFDNLVDVCQGSIMHRTEGGQMRTTNNAGVVVDCGLPRRNLASGEGCWIGRRMCSHAGHVAHGVRSRLRRDLETKLCLAFNCPGAVAVAVSMMNSSGQRHRKSSHPQGCNASRSLHSSKPLHAFTPPRLAKFWKHAAQYTVPGIRMVMPFRTVGTGDYKAVYRRLSSIGLLLKGASSEMRALALTESGLHVRDADAAHARHVALSPSPHVASFRCSGGEGRVGSESSWLKKVGGFEHPIAFQPSRLKLHVGSHLAHGSMIPSPRRSGSGSGSGNDNVNCPS